ncbi:MAG: alpha/beta hydrolase, partial [Beijerinckiaceae bacterium]
ARGVTVGIAGYDLCPDVTIGAIAGQMRRAALLFAMTQKAERLVVTGHSAGGHLTACLAAADWAAEGHREPLVAAGLAISGLFDLEPLVPTSVNAKLGLTPAEARTQSPRLLHPPEGLVFDCWVGGDESNEYLRQSRTLAAVWAGCGAETTYAQVPGANHFTVIAGLAEGGSAITARLFELAAGGAMPAAG